MTLERALIDARPLWGPGLEGQIEGRLGLLDLLEGRKAEARWHLGRALAVLRSVGTRWGVREALTALAALAAVDERREQATTLIAAAGAAYDGPPSEAEEILLARYLHDLPDGLAHYPANRLSLTAAQLDTILRDVAQDDQTLVQPGTSTPQRDGN